MMRLLMAARAPVDADLAASTGTPAHHLVGGGLAGLVVGVGVGPCPHAAAAHRDAATGERGTAAQRTGTLHDTSGSGGAHSPHQSVPFTHGYISVIVPSSL